MTAHPIIYSDETLESVRAQLMQMDAVLVWVNPIENGQSRKKLNRLLRELSTAGIYVSAHPDIIDTMGSKGVLVSTRDMSWGSDTYQYNDFEQLQAEFPVRLLSNGPRVLKKHSDSSGSGVWKVELVTHPSELTRETKDNLSLQHWDIPIRVRQAARGSEDKITSLGDFLLTIKPYLEETGYVVDQVFQHRLQEGIIRCYMVSNTVVGFGHQEVNALLPTVSTEQGANAPSAGPRIYYPPDSSDFQNIKKRMETEWLEALLKKLNLDVDQLPVLWDASFLLGSGNELDHDAYMLCEINTSSVHPFPDSVPEIVASSVLRKLLDKAK